MKTLMMTQLKTSQHKVLHNSAGSVKSMKNKDNRDQIMKLFSLTDFHDGQSILF